MGVHEMRLSWLVDSVVIDLKREWSAQMRLMNDDQEPICGEILGENMMMDGTTNSLCGVVGKIKTKWKSEIF
jgi:hypothetical protein